jgi:hypothetical protein
MLQRVQGAQSSSAWSHDAYPMPEYSLFRRAGRVRPCFAASARHVGLCRARNSDRDGAGLR